MNPEQVLALLALLSNLQLTVNKLVTDNESLSAMVAAMQPTTTPDQAERDPHDESAWIPAAAR